MSAAGDGRTSGDLIGEYLDQLRAGLRVAPGEAELILAEAEDHLRETAAAGVSHFLHERPGPGSTRRLKPRATARSGQWQWSFDKV